MDLEEADLREQIFHNNVREQIIFLLLFIMLYLASYALIEKFRRKDHEDCYSTDEDEIIIYRISVWLCTFALTITVGSLLLLPISIVSNEVLLIYPDSYYVKWLNSSLIQGLWNHVFLFSNLSLFVLLPFAYLFTESSGFFGHRSGVMSRVYETCTVLALLAGIVLGFTYVISSLVDKNNTTLETLNLWNYYLPFLYSCVSFIGVLMLLVCTPLGFVRLFGVVGQILVKPQFLRDINEEFFAYSLEEQTVRRRLKLALNTGESYISPPPISPPLTGSPIIMHNADMSSEETDSSNLFRLRNGELQAHLNVQLQQVQEKRELADSQRHTSSFRRNIVYPFAVLLLLLLTGIAVLMVLQNTLELLVGFKALPISTSQFTLGIRSLSRLGPIGAALEVAVLLYLAAASCTGLYGCAHRLRPRPARTPLSHLVANCAMLLILSSALPVLAKILGVTNFDLLGDFGSIEWLGNFKLVLLYNLVFATAATLCLINKFTATVRRELYNRLVENVNILSDCVTFLN
ncbi:LMBR1-like protein lilipod isoform X2 [Arctopsyche grandis]|uniref:LMBR1-like protein lilipod isoform X2 n=1 Tax=Arctopsyche grandis TaxID=121162 RepID=UPI00406D9B91